MTAAGVQNLDSASYLPPPTSTSTSDAKGSGAAGKANDPQAADTAGRPSDFQSELAHQTGTQETAPASQTGSTQTGSTQNGSAKTGSGKPEKKKDARTDDANPAVVMPVQVADPQKPILPFSLALVLPQENAKLDQSAEPSEEATPDDVAQGPAQQLAQPLSPTVSAVAQLPELPQLAVTEQPSATEQGQATATKQPSVAKQPEAPKHPAKLKPSATPEEALPIPVANVASSAASDSSKTLPPASSLPPASLTLASLPLTPAVPVGNVTTDSVGSSSPDKAQDQAQNRTQDHLKISAQPGGSLESQPVPRIEVQLPAAPAEPAASAVQETVDSAPSSPSALAFAARMAVASQKAGQPVAANATQIPAASGSQTPDQIPMRHAATAQIIRSTALGMEQDGPKKDAGPSIDKFARPDARTDMVVSRFETSSEPAPSSGPTAPQQAAPLARSESVIEPPAVPPTSSHDIRVRVPDNNGGSTQVRFVESGGEVRVSVRTADDGLAQNLRTHLNDLTQRLSDGGMPAEIWKPVSNAASSQNDQQPSHQDGRGSGGQGSGGQGGQQERQQQRPAWLDEMEASLQGEQG
ncbi:MAG: hypothetical protein LAP61_20900 [Acidobacteriia bacterium]|nr:hypothetical protein [Terriglobia bacterium]